MDIPSSRDPPSLPPPVANRLLEELGREQCRRLREAGTVVDLRLGQVLHAADSRTAHVYFPTGAIISLVTHVDGHATEIGMVGAEGMLGVHHVLGVARAPFEALIQGSGPALRIGARDFEAELAGSPDLRHTMGRYAYVLLRQTATAAVCMHAHQTTPRLARWLLMMQDRACSTGFFATQQFLSLMLGVRRAGVSTAAGELRAMGCISYVRGRVTVRERGVLRAAACACYESDLQVYAGQLRPRRGR